MKKNLFFTVHIVLSIIFISFTKANNHSFSLKENNNLADASLNSIHCASLGEVLYDSLNLDQSGLSKEAVDYAVKGYEKLSDSGMVNNQLLTIVDLSQSSRNRRFYILDMKIHKLVWNTFVAHGKNSGADVAENFSNDFNSDESSLGFYLTKSTYTGKHGLSLRISGLENGFNNNAEARGIVVHGAAYVSESRAKTGYMGRSQGCPALAENEYAKVINIIKGGSVVFVYHPSAAYLQSSSLLNS